MFLKLKQQPKERAQLDNNLRLLTTNAQALNSLLDYLEYRCAEAESDFNVAAQRAVFDDDLRADAVHKHGIYEGFVMIYQRLLDLQTSQK